MRPLRDLSAQGHMLKVLTGCSQAILSPHQVDGILKYLDAAEHTVLSSSDNAAVCHHNFAVFASRPARNTTSDNTSPSPTSAPRSCLTDEVNSVSESTDHLVYEVFSHSLDAHDAYIVGAQETNDEPHEDPLLSAESPVVEVHVANAPSDGALEAMDIQLAVTDDWLDAGGSPPSSPRSGLDLDHFLMRHYAERVCHLFCVIDTVKSPWKTIHLPRALQSMGEFSVTGKTTTVRSALCNALLSISAWYLSNDHHRHQNTELGQRWAEVAAKRGYNAIAMLKKAVESDMYSSPKPKYKEFLASMLSMVTINVSRVSGVRIR